MQLHGIKARYGDHLILSMQLRGLELVLLILDKGSGKKIVWQSQMNALNADVVETAKYVLIREASQLLPLTETLPT